MFNLSIVPYLFSKISVLTFFSVVQTFLFVIILLIFYDNSTVKLNNLIYSFYGCSTSIAATCLGLFYRLF